MALRRHGDDNKGRSLYFPRLQWLHQKELDSASPVKSGDYYPFSIISSDCTLTSQLGSGNCIFCNSSPRFLIIMTEYLGCVATLCCVVL